MNFNLDKVPSTLDEAVQLLKEATDNKEQAVIKTLDRYQLHFSLGQFIRNEWSLWNTGNVLNVWFRKKYGVDHADDISSIILDCLINDLNNKPRRDLELAKDFIEHWQSHKKKITNKKNKD